MEGEQDALDVEHRPEFIVSLKLALIEERFVATPVALLAGSNDETVGLVVSAVDPVVKVTLGFPPETELPAASV